MVGLWSPVPKFNHSRFTPPTMDKRTFLKISSLAGAGLVTVPLVSTLIGCSNGTRRNENPSGENPAGGAFSLPELGFAHEALEPAIDGVTMRIHHGKHHAGYVRKLNAALEGHALSGASLEDILAKIGPDDTALRNNGGGHFNHALFWNVLKPGGDPQPTGALANRINACFGNQENLLRELTSAAGSRFGSGWAWLVQDKNDPNRLFVASTPNQDNPLMTGVVDANTMGRPVLGIDVWEHAYYLNYQNRRTDYVTALLERVNWTAVSRLMA